MLYLACEWANASATPPVPTFGWEPDVGVSWQDTNGIFTDTLTNFNLNADKPTVTMLNAQSKGLTNIHTLTDLPNLVNVNVSFCFLTVAMVDGILADLVANGKNGGQLITADQTPVAPPSNPAGQADKTTLSNAPRSWLMLTD